ncbi:DNA polymerase III subunit gamma/tau [Candidatus Sumerlaeota bacterium]|nr:DNA polymerase III subunit gamma/tau [Candidatus Sumerlaeota bacterium]
MTTPRKKAKTGETKTEPAAVPVPDSAPEYQVLARKYRPATFSEVVGQDLVVRQLQGDITDGRIGHAYLFTGPRGVGKTSMARIFAKAVNCVEGPTPKPCLRCVHCLAIASDSDLDVVEVDAATYTKKEETIELLEGLDRVSFSARYKVYIIDEVHMFSNQSFNVLLKRLEEPPPGVVFILATTNPEKLPDTVVSRCRRLEFDRMASNAIVERLAEIADRESLSFKAGEREKVLEAIALASEGGMRDAQVSLDQMISLSEGELTLETARQLLGTVETDLLHGLLGALTARDTTAALLLVNELVEKGRDLQKFVKVFTAYLRDAMLLKAGASEELLKVSRADAGRLRDSVATLSMPTLLNAMQQFLELEERMRGAAPPRFLLEFAIMKLTAIHPRFVLDGIDAGSGPRAPQGSVGVAAAAPRGGAPSAAATSRAVLSYQDSPQKPAGNAPRMTMPANQPTAAALPAPLVMRRSSAAAVEPAPILVGDELISDESIEAFRNCVNGRLKSHLRVFSDAKISVENGVLQIMLRAGDAVVRPQLDKPDVMGEIRRALVESCGCDLPISIAVAERTATIIPMEPAPGLSAPEMDSVREGSDEDFAVPPRPVSSDFARKLTFEQALDKFPDFREAIDLVRKHCDAIPVFFNDQKIN